MYSMVNQACHRKKVSFRCFYLKIDEEELRRIDRLCLNNVDQNENK